MSIHIQKKEKKELPVNLKPPNSPRHTLSQTEKKRKKTVSESQNHSNANTHTHTRAHNYKHIKFQLRVKQTKVKREKDPYINPPGQPKII